MFLPILILLIGIPVPAQASPFNITDAGIVRPGNTSSLVIPSTALKWTDDGQLILNQGTGSGDAPGDDHRKKPRPFFLDKNTMGLVEAEHWLDQMITAISPQLDQPMSATQTREYHEWIDQLESELGAFRQWQELENIARDFAIEPGTVFIHHPGYQNDHPAHSETRYSQMMPEMITAGIGYSRAAGYDHNSSDDSDDDGSPADTGGYDTPSDSGNRDTPDSSDSGGQDGDNDPPGKKPENKIICQKESQTTHLVTKVLADGTELEAHIPEYLYCSICMDLGEDVAVQCMGCENIVCCLSHIQANHQPECPLCRFTKPPGQLWLNLFQRRRAKKNLVWQCAAKCGASGTTSEMTGHKARCPGFSETCSACPNQGCTASGTAEFLQGHLETCDFALTTCRHKGCNIQEAKKDIEQHESVCLFRPVPLGRYRLPAFQREVIYSVVHPEEATSHSLSLGQLSAAILAVSYLFQLIQADDSDGLEAGRCASCQQSIAESSQQPVRQVDLRPGLRLKLLPQCKNIFVRIDNPRRMPGSFELYLRADLSAYDGSGEETVVRTILAEEFQFYGVVFITSVKLSHANWINNVELSFGYAGSKSQLRGSWLFKLLNHNGTPLANQVIDYEDITTPDPGLNCVMNDSGSCYSYYFERSEGNFWSHPSHERVVYFWFKFIPQLPEIRPLRPPT